MFVSSTNNKRTTFSLAGWLFADLMLGLWAVFMVTNPAPKPDIPTLTPTLTATPTPTVTSTMVPTATIISTPTPLPTDVGPIGLSDAQCYNLELDGTLFDDGSERQAILSQLEGQIPNDKNLRAGLVLVWGHGQDIPKGRQLAMRVGNIISEKYPLSFSAETEKKSMGFDHGSFKHVQIEIYFFTDGNWKSGREMPCEYLN